jgi:hypothetical protein
MFAQFLWEATYFDAIATSTSDRLGGYRISYIRVEKFCKCLFIVDIVGAWQREPRVSTQEVVNKESIIERFNQLGWLSNNFQFLRRTS